MGYKLVVVGVSAGGLNALKILFSSIDDLFVLPIIIVQHMHPESDDYLANYLSEFSALTFKEADEKEKIKKGTVYIAPANYHLMIDEDETLALTTDHKVNFCRPAIDILFESAVEVYGKKVIGIILTGANSDGALGMKKIKEAGGLTIIQDPQEAHVDTMPSSVKKIIEVDHSIPLKEIGKLLNKVGR